MKFVRKITNSDVLANIIDIPEELRNKKVEVIILPYENMEDVDLKEQKNKRVRGALAKYKNKDLQEKESEAWANAAVEKYANS
ncbi:hypothetical protein [Calorimonas adulescens]|uniref:Uncharacterized protein n=1 Tax=Calorimonas adulescens TaxID=2606906 RepID=A0A5D8Q9P5_9THEO|nr:hypothetical protein [Calorimonas adulescens]TZE80839.1 hypothetical protein FWJ32_11595 [Calorimonas adulescens]